MHFSLLAQLPDLTLGMESESHILKADGIVLLSQERSQVTDTFIKTLIFKNFLDPMHSLITICKM